jgi:hypothetical protein
MSLTSLLSIRNAIFQLYVQGINGTQSSGLNFSAITTPYTAMALAQAKQEDSDYPKIVMPVDSGIVTQLPAKQRRKKTKFDIIIVLKATNPQPEVSPPAVPFGDVMLKLIDDFSDLVAASPTLGGIVTNVDIEDWTTDSGFSYPEGVAWFKLAVEYQGS